MSGIPEVAAAILAAADTTSFTPATTGVISAAASGDIREATNPDWILRWESLPKPIALLVFDGEDNGEALAQTGGDGGDSVSTMSWIISVIAESFAPQGEGSASAYTLIEELFAALHEKIVLASPGVKLRYAGSEYVDATANAVMYRTRWENTFIRHT